MALNDKTCDRCHIRKPIRDYDAAQQRICTACRREVNLPAAPVRPKAGDDLTTYRAEWNRYQRLRKRVLARQRDKTKPAPAPAPKPGPYREPLPKKCRACGRILAATMFESPRFRLCRQCDV